MKEHKFKVGDRVWYCGYGVGTLESNDNPHYPLALALGRDEECFTEDGKRLSRDRHRSLFTLEEAESYGWIPKPPRELWVNFYPRVSVTYGSKESADKDVGSERIGEAVLFREVLNGEIK